MRAGSLRARPRRISRRRRKRLSTEVVERACASTAFRSQAAGMGSHGGAVEPNAGFSTAPPWLPIPAAWDRNAVDAQARSTTSVLSLFRRLLEIRRGLARRLPARMEWEAVPKDCLMYHRGP